MIQQAIPVLPSANLKATIMFYESKLGFTAINKGGYVIFKKNNTELHFVQCDDEDICAQTSCFIRVTDIECLYTELSSQEVIQLKGQLKDQPGGIREFTIRDNNGILLRFAQQDTTY
ncbi:MAG: VOC family protein [Bacteroidetes bacterium]|nr:VOC family protein [Bacteroidota bacterium]